MGIRAVCILLFCSQFYSVFSAQTCNHGEEICKDECYDSTQFDCSENELCPKGQILCHARYGTPECYNPTSHHCINGQTICPVGQNDCSGTCYSPDEQTCLNDYTLCAIGQQSCADQCYNPVTDGKICSPDGRALCNIGEENCGLDCYDPKTGAKCFNDGGTLCQAGEEICGYECYDPKRQSCFDNKKICASTRIPCGDSLCYWPQNETCHTDRKGYDPIVCKSKLKACGNECYYYGGQTTCTKSVDGVEQLCPLNSELCGYTCYTPSVTKNKCVKGTICKPHEEACAKECYNPKKIGRNVGCQKKEKKIKTAPFLPVKIIEYEVLECNPGYNASSTGNGDCFAPGEEPPENSRAGALGSTKPTQIICIVIGIVIVSFYPCVNL